MTFKSDISEFKKLAAKNVEIAFKKIAFDSAESIIKRTPVDSGRAKGNWHVSLDRPVNSIFDVEDADGDLTLQQAKSDIKGASIGGSIFVLNNLPYIEKLEDGSSLQAPNGMVSITVSQYSRIAKKAARAVLNKTVRDLS